jgi:hypothetical protein
MKSTPVGLLLRLRLDDTFLWQSVFRSIQGFQIAWLSRAHRSLYECRYRSVSSVRRASIEAQIFLD